MKQIREHHFKIEEAVKYGIEKAVILYNLRFWLDKNEANKSNIKEKDGVNYYWTFNSSRAFTELFPYLKESSVRRWLQELEKDGVIISGSFNKTKYDQTKWYTMKDYSIDQNEQWNDQNEQPIPDNKHKIINTSTSSIDEGTDKPFKEKKIPLEFNFENELKKLSESKWKPDKIIALFWMRKKWKFENAKQFKTERGRQLKPAKALEGYNSEQLTKAFQYCEDNYNNFNWGLETCLKVIAKAINE